LQQLEWAAELEEFAAYYREFGTGIFAQYRALRWQAGQIVGIQHSDPVTLNQLVGYEFQREVLVNNTEFLLAGYPA
ncbi:DUF815 domain-containing protein, partial [Klebsiella pneumoniae]|uniref:DUF815 domain-containing protein n=1 Tax=Klebsiella pneumoniae TaxID=573 RepID=UPI00132F5A68